MLTESTVLAVPMHVMEGTVTAEECGVSVRELQGARSPGRLLAAGCPFFFFFGGGGSWCFVLG